MATRDFRATCRDNEIQWTVDEMSGEDKAILGHNLTHTKSWTVGRPLNPAIKRSMGSGGKHSMIPS
jgi:hypothetical protein